MMVTLLREAEEPVSAEKLIAPPLTPAVLLVNLPRTMGAFTSGR